VLYAAFGSSRYLITGPMSATTALSAAAVADLATGGPANFAAYTKRGGVRLALAHGIGQVRDVLEEAAVEGTEPLLLYPTVQSAVAALRPD